MRKIKMILAVIIVAVLAISCNNPSSLAKDYESALKKKNFEKAAKVIEKAADKCASWSTKEKDAFSDAISDATNNFLDHASPKTYKKFWKVMMGSFEKLEDAMLEDEDKDEDWGDEDDDDDWGDEDKDEDDEW